MKIGCQQDNADALSAFIATKVEIAGPRDRRGLDNRPRDPAPDA